MLRSLFAGISGLRTHQVMMDVTGNNIANVNTAGYKTSQVVFEDTLSQLLKAAGAPQNANGGINPAQVGLGTKMGQISMNFGQGAAQVTSRNTDLMIQGDGLFVVQNAGEQQYTRAGAFTFDTDGRLVTSEGGVLQGWIGLNGVIDTNTVPRDITLPVGTLMPAIATTEATFNGNLPADTTVATPITVSIKVFDSQGNSSMLQASFTKVSLTQWDVTITNGATSVGPTAINFDTDGTDPTPATVTVGGIDVDLSGVTNFAGASTIAPGRQDGSAMGSLQGYSVSPEGTLVGVFSNGLKQSLAQIALASFNNPPGLQKIGGSMYRSTVNSGIPQIGTAGSGGRGLLSSGSLEMSNVDLGLEFTNLIVAQRGFQANSKVITTSDELLQDLVNLKR